MNTQRVASQYLNCNCGAARCVSSTNARATCAGNGEDSTGLAVSNNSSALLLSLNRRGGSRSPTLTGVDSPVACPIGFGIWPPFGASDFTPHAAGCIVQVKRAPGMQFLCANDAKYPPRCCWESECRSEYACISLKSLHFKPRACQSTFAGNSAPPPCMLIAIRRPGRKERCGWPFQGSGSIDLRSEPDAWRTRNDEQNQPKTDRRRYRP